MFSCKCLHGGSVFVWVFDFVCMCISELYLCASERVCEREHVCVFVCVFVRFECLCVN